MSRRKTYEFLQLTNTLPYPAAVKAQLSTVHARLIEQVCKSFDNTKATKENIVHIFNCVSYMYISGDSLPTSWDANDPLHTYLNYNDEFLESQIQTCFLHPKDIDWIDVPISEDHSKPVVTPSVKSITASKQVPTFDPISVEDVGLVSSVPHTHKSDLYIQPPTVPRFNTNAPFASGNVDGTPFVVYSSLPEIPTKQNEISATTNINKLTDADLLKLFPTQFIRTRAECMYNPCNHVELDERLGLIIPIEGFTKKQVRDNIIKYPHLFKLLKDVDGVPESFYSTLEIDGKLHKISEVWEQLPVSKHLPYAKEFIKEYVVRRYLLERDIKGVEHRYKLYGTLDPFLTLFTTFQEYSEFGYTDSVAIARNCVCARVNYKQSRNPILRRLSDV